MRIHTYDAATFDSFRASLAYVTDYHSLSDLTGIWPRVLSFLLRDHNAERKNQQRAIVRRKGREVRVVYQSGPQLDLAQTMLEPLFAQMGEQLPTDQLLAYKRGTSYAARLRDCVGHDALITCDIRKYYDSITYAHLVKTFTALGMTEQGAKLVARLCVVERTLGHGKTISTLQQGSRCSPILSNLVGTRAFDIPILAWLEREAQANPQLRYRYLRYSDNLALFFSGAVPLDFPARYKAAVNAAMGAARFATHKWSFIKQNHPKRAMKWLGLVLNKLVRVERQRLELMRSILFNCCVNGFGHEALTYWEKHPLPDADADLAVIWENERALLIERFVEHLQGMVSYIASVNKAHGLELGKLLAAAKCISGLPPLRQAQNAAPRGTFRLETDCPGLLEAVKRYRAAAEPKEAYCARVETALKNSGLAVAWESASNASPDREDLAAIG